LQGAHDECVPATAPPEPLFALPDELLDELLDELPDELPAPLVPEPVVVDPFDRRWPWSVVVVAAPLVAWAAATISRPVAEPAARTRPAVAILARVTRRWRCADMSRESP
jgi:hypothetical protein